MNPQDDLSDESSASEQSPQERRKVEPRAARAKQSRSDQFKVRELGSKPVERAKRGVERSSSVEESVEKRPVNAFKQTSEQQDLPVEEKDVSVSLIPKWLLYSMLVGFFAIGVGLFGLGKLQKSAPKSSNIDPRAPSEMVARKAPQEIARPVDKTVLSDYAKLLQLRLEAIKLYADFQASENLEQSKKFLYNAEGLNDSDLRKYEQEIDWDIKKVVWNAGYSPASAFATLSGKTKDFRPFSIFFRLEQEDLKIDWKATVRYSSASFEELMKGQGDTSEIRGLLTGGKLYSMNYSEETHRSYLIASPLSEGVVWGFVSRNSELDRELVQILKEAKNKAPITITLSKSNDLRVNQWEIDAIVSPNWLTTK